MSYGTFAHAHAIGCEAQRARAESMSFSCAAVFLREYLWRSDRQREKAVAGNGAPLAVAGVGPVEFAGEGRLQQLWRRW